MGRKNSLAGRKASSLESQTGKPSQSQPWRSRDRQNTKIKKLNHKGNEKAQKKVDVDKKNECCKPFAVPIKILEQIQHPNNQNHLA